MAAPQGGHRVMGPLNGYRIAVPETRELELFARMIEQRGGIAIRCPLVAIREVEDPASVLAWLRALTDGAFDDVVFYTGEGVRRLLELARAQSIEEGVLDALRRTRKIVRGPKPTRALRTVDLSPDLLAPEPTTDGLIALFARLEMTGQKVGVQTYPGDPGALARYLADAGAEVAPVLCYRYASQEDDSRVAELIRAMAAGEVDFVAFTSRPQIELLQVVARKLEIEGELATDCSEPGSAPSAPPRRRLSPVPAGRSLSLPTLCT
jgi:uroporphyrinogen-III synthase